MKNMRAVKKVSVLLFLLYICSLSVFAANNVSEIDISVTVRNDGSAYIVQEWRGSFSEGTENYIPINTEEIELSSFGVSDETGAYEFVENWDIDASFEEKIRKCGVVETADGVELCFGISEYGERRYAIEYIVEGFIKSYADRDGTNFMFINPGMSTFPTDAHIIIELENGNPLSDVNAGVWGFGFDGNVEFRNGKIHAYTISSLSGNEHMTVMFCLDKGLVSPLVLENASFDTVKERAFVGSDYDDIEEDADGGILGTIFVIFVLIIIPLILILIAVFLIKRKIELKRFYKSVDYFRDIPNGGDISLSHYLAANFDVSDDESFVLGALILSMINGGCILPLTEEIIGLFGGIRQSVNLKLVREPEKEVEKRLYRVLIAAAGEDGVLQERELEKYAYKNCDAVKEIIDATKNEGESTFISSGGFNKGAGNCVRDLSERGKASLAEVMGLKKYLDEFSLISERSITETAIWKDYMVYATLLGIAEKVIKQLEKLCPERLAEFEAYNRNVVVANSYYRSIYHSAKRAQAARSGGSGGSASFGGGGGFSGGGSGGGSR